MRRQLKTSHSCVTIETIQMNIRTRITLLVALTFIAISAIGGFAVYQSRGNARQVRAVTEGVFPSTLASADLVSRFKHIQLTVVSLVFESNPEIAKQARDRLVAQKIGLLDELDQQLADAGNDKQRGLVNAIRESVANYFESVDEVITLRLAGQQEFAAASLAANATQYQRETEQMVEALRIEKYRSKDDAIAALSENLNTTSLAIGVVTVITIIVLTGIGVLLYRRIAGPIGRMQAMMSEIAANQDFSRRLPVDQDDEIGRSMRAFNAMLEKIEESSALLRQKTSDIQNMLRNIPQGILTVEAGHTIHPEYSAYLENILERDDIAGHGVMEVVFAGSNTGADLNDRIIVVIGACLGEDIMNFEFNRHLLPGEIGLGMADGRVKTLDLCWSPIADDAGSIVRLMLCIRDVTELRALAAEAKAQERTLATIGEILAVSQEKFHQFILDAIEFVDQNEIIIHRHPEANTEAIAQLFRNMHTIKGNARTYGLQHMTHVVHEAEQAYSELRKPRPGVAWDQAMLIEQLAVVKAEIERYSRINEVSLGRKGPGRRGGIERYLMVDRHQIHEALHLLETTNNTNLHELLAARDAVHKTLRLLGTELLGETLASVIDALPSLARELGKEAPQVIIDNNGYVVRNQAGGLLKNIFMHLVRNAVDHGIELPEARRQRGKPPAGTIRLRIDVELGMLRIMLADDGQGLALARIRQSAKDKGLIDAALETQVDDETVAALIFRPAFSTADKVTEISGRGVGMDAVQDFVHREGGSIEIRFTDQAIGADFRSFQFIVSLPENIAVRVDQT